jgi:hypothetical protein
MRRKQVTFAKKKLYENSLLIIQYKKASSSKSLQVLEVHNYFNRFWFAETHGETLWNLWILWRRNQSSSISSTGAGTLID